MPYCSKACQDGDHAQQTTLCDWFKDLQDQHFPSSNHRRVIYFLHNEDRPHFVWLKYDGEPKSMLHELQDLEQYIPDPPEGVRSCDNYR